VKKRDKNNQGTLSKKIDRDMSLKFFGDNEFQSVKKYVVDGLDADADTIFNMIDDEHEDEMNKGKRWIDTVQGYDYKKMYDNNREVIDAKRFLDGMTSDFFGYGSEDECLYGKRGDNQSSWCREFKAKSTIVFRFLEEKELQEAGETKVTLCSLASHSFEENSCFCATLNDQRNLMNAYISDVEGYQSQTFMRGKIYDLIATDVKALPKTTSKVVTDATQVKYVHSIGVILFTFVSAEMWLGFKIYSSDDFEEMFDALGRCNAVLKLLLKLKTFESQDMFHTFLIFFKEIKAIDSFNDDIMYIFEDDGLKKKRFFSKKELATYDTACKALKEKFGSKLASVSIIQDEGLDVDVSIIQDEGLDVEGGEKVDGGHDVNIEEAVKPSSDVGKRKKESSSSSSSSKIAKKKR